MSHPFLDIARTDAVRTVESQMGVGHIWDDFDSRRRFDRFDVSETAFIAERDSFYMATVSETGWPYVQHRGGPPGFLKVVDPQTLAFADFRGNLQYISAGNLVTNKRACLFLMDYPRRARLKLYVSIEVLSLDEDTSLAELTVVPGYRAKVERIFRLRLEAFDWNCSQHIVKRFTETDVAHAILPLRERLEQLEAENAVLRAQIPGSANSSRQASSST